MYQSIYHRVPRHHYWDLELQYEQHLIQNTCECLLRVKLTIKVSSQEKRKPYSMTK